MAKLFLPTATVVNTAKFPDLPGVYIGREWAGRPCSRWANPFTVGTDSPERRRVVVWQFVLKLMDHQLRFDLETLRGENLLCWCVPGLCHGTALAFLLSQKQIHGQPCKQCGHPQESILNLWQADKHKATALIYEFAKCPACGYYHYNDRCMITPDTFETWAESAAIDEGALDSQPTLL